MTSILVANIQKMLINEKIFIEKISKLIMEDEKWNDLRNSAAINALNAILSSSFMTFIIEFIFKKDVAKIAVDYADELIEELKAREREKA